MSIERKEMVINARDFDPKVEKKLDEKKRIKFQKGIKEVTLETEGSKDRIDRVNSLVILINSSIGNVSIKKKHFVIRLLKWFTGGMTHELIFTLHMDDGKKGIPITLSIYNPYSKKTTPPLAPVSQAPDAAHQVAVPVRKNVGFKKEEIERLKEAIEKEDTGQQELIGRGISLKVKLNELEEYFNKNGVGSETTDVSKFIVSACDFLNLINDEKRSLSDEEKEIVNKIYSEFSSIKESIVANKYRYNPYYVNLHNSLTWHQNLASYLYHK